MMFALRLSVFCYVLQSAHFLALSQNILGGTELMTRMLRLAGTLIPHLSLREERQVAISHITTFPIYITFMISFS